MKNSPTTPESQEFSEILQQIQTAKNRAVKHVNSTLVDLYWGIGEYISTQVTLDRSGKNTVKNSRHSYRAKPQKSKASIPVTYGG